MTLPEPPEFVEFLAPYPEATQTLARTLRRMLVERLPDCIETVWDATNAVGVAYGFTERNPDHFVHLPVYTAYVNIGFPHGAFLDDPENRLKGSGARVRHIKLVKPADLDDPYVWGLIRQAQEAAVRPDGTVAPRTIVRVMEGPKRRPRQK